MNQNVIRSITIVSVLLCLLWIIGLGWTINRYYAKSSAAPQPVKQVTQSPVKNSKEMKIVALGDSLTKGLGDETGKGYVGDVADEVKKRTKKQVSLMNLGISGQTSDQLRGQIQQPEVQRQIHEANIVLLTIGGNDLFRGGQGLSDYKTAEIAAVEKKYLKNLTFILGKIRQVNKQANVFFVGLYNPFFDLSIGEETSKVVRLWNYDSAEVSADFPKVVFVPTFDLFELKVNDFLYSDKFHPNTKGYHLIAERVASLLTW